MLNFILFNLGCGATGFFLGFLLAKAKYMPFTGPKDKP